MNRATFGGWLKMQRAMRQLSQAALARELEMNRSHIVKMEQGDIKLPGEATRERFHVYFGTTDDDLVAAGVLTRLDFPGRPPVYLPAGEKPAAPTPQIGGADVVTIPADDPRAEVVDLLEGAPPSVLDAVLRVARLLSPHSGASADMSDLAPDRDKPSTT